MKKNISLITLLACSLLPFSAEAKAEKKKTTEKPKVYLVANAHLDTQWLWDVQTTIDEFLRNTVKQNFHLFEKDPNYVFNFEGGIKYQWIKEYYPEDFEKLKKYIKEGRWHIAGASWDANDPNVPSIESSIRNILLGQEFYKKEFGIKSKDIFLPDCFGFSYTLPTVAAHCDLLGFSTQKLQWRDKPFYGDKKIPFVYGVWKGIDGNSILAVLDGEDYTWRPHSSLLKDEWIIKKAQESPIKAHYKYHGTVSAYGQGDRGGSAAVISQKVIEEDMKEKNSPVQFIHARSSQIFEDYPIAKNPKLPRFDGELLMDFHGVGCYTSQAAMKHYNRRNEQLGDAAERASVIAEWMGLLPYAQEKINDAWKRFIWHQFHDDLTGTSIPKVYEFSWNDELIAQTQFNDVTTEASRHISSQMDTQTEGTPVLVYNPTAYSRHDVAEILIPAGEDTQFTVFTSEGKELKTQTLSVKDGKAQIIFECEVSPLSYTVFDVRPAETGKVNANLAAQDKTIENKIYKITVNDQGNISSLIDKRNQRELVKQGSSIGLIILDENIIDAYPAWEIKKATLDRAPLPINENVNIQIEEVGNLRTVLKIDRKFGDSSITQRIILRDGPQEDRIDIVNDIDWATKKSLLKAQFPVNFKTQEALYDLGIGAIKRSINTETAFEVPAQHWASQTDEESNYSLTVLNDCKYGWDKPDEHTLRLTLLHTPESGNFSHQNSLDFGKHHFTYSLIGHEGDALQAGMTEKGESLNQPLLTYTVPKHEGSLGKAFSFATSSTPQMAIKALKKAENGVGYIVRVYETQGEDLVDAELSFPSEIISAEETNGIEEKKGKPQINGNKLIVNAGKFAPKTFRIQLKSDPINTHERHFQSLELPYNTVAISSDAFAPVGNMDGNWNSYSGELMPETILSGIIPFTMGEPDIPNAVTCKEQKIALPEGSTGRQISFLVAAKNEDKDTIFRLGDQEFKVSVPYYGGYYGQWGWKGHSDSFVKKGKLAYIGNHKHHPSKINISYSFTYLYQVDLIIPEGATELTLPQDDKIVVFAATINDEHNNKVEPAKEARVLP